jgi:hypothetical protein
MIMARAACRFDGPAFLPGRAGKILRSSAFMVPP